MGTDIHMEIERREGAGWSYVPHITRDCWACACANERRAVAAGRPVPAETRPDCYLCKGTGRSTEAYYHDRDYDVFAILADVRNGRGFAGIDTGDGFVPIAQPRGLPADMSFELRRLTGLTTAQALLRGEPEDDAPLDVEGCHAVWLGDHSFSWLLVSEILAHDWTLTTKHRGWCSPGQYRTFRKTGKPDGWSGGVSGPSVEHVSNAAMDRMIADGTISFTGEANKFDGELYTARHGRQYYTLCEWQETYAESAERFLAVVRDDILPLGNPGDLRLVFGFDS